MGTSKVTDFMIEYMQKHDVLVREIALELGIKEEKLQNGYTDPLDAEEFLELCVKLRLRPEEVAEAIRLKE